MESVKDISNGIQRLKESLNTRPTDLESYVQFVKDLNEGIDKKATLDGGRKLAQEQKDCLNRYKSKDLTRPSKVNN
jgi:23S rRNA A2030 N6-methylase RlmJ